MLDNAIRYVKYEKKPAVIHQMAMIIQARFIQLMVKCNTDPLFCISSCDA